MRSVAEFLIFPGFSPPLPSEDISESYKVGYYLCKVAIRGSFFTLPSLVSEREVSSGAKARLLIFQRQGSEPLYLVGRGGGRRSEMMISRGLFGWSPPPIQPLTPVSEVSEPPESPSPYIDNSAEGPGAVPSRVEQEEEAEDVDEAEEPLPAAVPFLRLFLCADSLDWILMAVGSIAAAAHGAALVVYLHYFAKIVHVLHLGPSAKAEEYFHRFKEVSLADVMSLYCCFACWDACEDPKKSVFFFSGFSSP